MKEKIKDLFVIFIITFAIFPFIALAWIDLVCLFLPNN